MDGGKAEGKKGCRQGGGKLFMETRRRERRDGGKARGK
jgi:hypothetical protein